MKRHDEGSAGALTLALARARARQWRRRASWRILRRLALSALAGIALGGCGAEGDSYVVGAGKWQDFDVTVESRPAPPRPGKNEVVVIVTGARKQPIFDARVSVRAQDAADWVQAIEDGHVGVYRRAVDFGHADRASIEVHLQRGSEEAVLVFPVEIRADR